MRSLLLALFALLALPALALAQGALTPPGAPAPTMRTLEQLEPRIPLQAGAPGVTVNANGGFTITAPGSYYLTGNLSVASSSGITIESNHISLDLAGFNISSTSAAPEGSGITVPPNCSGIAIRNGRIFGKATESGGVFSGGGFNYGVYSYGYDTIVEHVAVFAVRATGIQARRISACYAQFCGTSGMVGDAVSDSTVEACGSHGIKCNNATNCTASTVGPVGDGIQAWGSVFGCSATSRGGAGIAAHTIENSIGESDSGYGLSATSATNCKGTSRSSTGLKATTAIGCYGKSSGTGLGLDAVTASSSYGESVNNTGLRAEASADNCRGVANGTGYGLYSGGNATNCTGKTATGNYGLYVVGTANTCRGDNDAASATKFALHAAIAVACTAETGTIEAAQKFHGTP